MASDTQRESGRSTTSGVSAVFRLGLAAALLVFAFALASAARADVNPPAFTLGTITIGDGTAVVTGAVEDVDARLEVNGLPVEIDQSGDFLAVVDLGADALVISLVGAPGETVTIRIPIDVLLESGGEGILDDLIAAGVTIDAPIDGLRIVDGQWSLISGDVLNDTNLAGLTINGVQVLDNLGPSGNFSIQLPWSSNPPDHVTVVATDHRGVSQSSTFRTMRITSVIGTRVGMSVSAAGARGVVIAKVRFVKRNLTTSKRLGVIVTVKDRRGFLVRGAALRLRGAPVRYLANGAARAGFTNRFGQARFVYRLHGRAFAGAMPRHLAVVTRAMTPTAAAKKRAVLRLPALAPH